MAKVKSETTRNTKAPMRKAITVEGREQQMIAYAVDLAEQQLRDRTASSQVITHYLKLGSRKNQLEMERLQEENKLLRAKTEALQSQRNIEELYADAIKAMQRYGSRGGSDDEDY